MKRHSFQLIALSSFLALTITACGGNSETPTTGSPVVPSSSAEVRTDEGATSTETTTTTTSESSDSEGDTSDAAETSNTNPPPKGQKLTLDDFADKTDGWQDSSFDVSDKSGITGIGTTLKGYYVCGTPETADLNLGSSSTRGLRLNLSHKYSTLEFKVGQDNSSVAVDQRVLVRITDGKKQIGDIHVVEFDEVVSVNQDVEGMNVLFLQFYLDDKVPECSSRGVTPVIYDVILD